MNYYVYILRSLKNGKYYIGQTKNMEERLKVHNSSRAKWTKMHQPWELVYNEIYETRSEAMKREKFLKKGGSLKKILSEIVSGKL